MSQSVVTNTPYDTLHLLLKIQEQYTGDKKLTTDNIEALAKVDYGEGVIKKGTIAQYLSVLYRIDEDPITLRHIKKACLEIEGVHAGKSQIYMNGLVSSVERPLTLLNVCHFHSFVINPYHFLIGGVLIF